MRIKFLEVVKKEHKKITKSIKTSWRNCKVNIKKSVSEKRIYNIISPIRRECIYFQ